MQSFAALEAQDHAMLAVLTRKSRVRRSLRFWQAFVALHLRSMERVWISNR